MRWESRTRRVGDTRCVRRRGGCVAKRTIDGIRILNWSGRPGKRGQLRALRPRRLALSDRLDEERNPGYRPTSILRGDRWLPMSESVGESSESLGSTSSDLLERVRVRDEQAWRRLVRLYGPLVLHWCRQFGLQEADRADVFQDVFRAVARHVAGFRRERPTDTFRGWLRTVTQSKVHEHFRRRGGNPEGVGGSSAYQRLLAVPDAASGSDDQPLSNDDAILLREVLRLLRGEFQDQTWQAFWRTAADGLPAAVVAQELGMSPGAVRTAKSRVLRRLREELRGEQ